MIGSDYKLKFRPPGEMPREYLFIIKDNKKTHIDEVIYKSKYNARLFSIYPPFRNAPGSAATKLKTSSAFLIRLGIIHAFSPPAKASSMRQTYFCLA